MYARQHTSLPPSYVPQPGRPGPGAGVWTPQQNYRDGMAAERGGSSRDAYAKPQAKSKRGAKDGARWHCPLGCGKFYRKSSSRSIQKHRITCFNNYMNVQSLNCQEIFGDDLRLKILSNTENSNLSADSKNPQGANGEKGQAVSTNLASTVVHYFCVGGRKGRILSTFKSPICNVSEQRLRYQCSQILIHAAKTDTEMVQMMASNSEMIYYHQSGIMNNQALIFIVAVPSSYRGDPIVQVLSDFKKTYKAKQNQAAQNMSPNSQFSSAYLESIALSKQKVPQPKNPPKGPSPRPAVLSGDSGECKKWPTQKSLYYRRPKQSRMLPDSIPPSDSRRIARHPNSMLNSTGDYRPVPPAAVARNVRGYHGQDMYHNGSGRPVGAMPYSDNSRLNNLPVRGGPNDPYAAAAAAVSENNRNMQNYMSAAAYSDYRDQAAVYRNAPPPYPTEGYVRRQPLPTRPNKKWHALEMEHQDQSHRNQHFQQYTPDPHNVWREGVPEPVKNRTFDANGAPTAVISRKRYASNADPVTQSMKRFRGGNYAEQPKQREPPIAKGADSASSGMGNGVPADLMKSIRQREAMFEAKSAQLRSRMEKLRHEKLLSK
mmetsp:Transcript_11027/g.17910  ORF Transcript_11027/g.17910 Transcript_11027/m.17910 type:complete len:600 (+) Transcript_11027:55-1854(+)|eukprot:jgi/Bigna1/132984/aug1.19_g7692